MAPKPSDFQPGAILHDAIMGALRAKGIRLEEWCARVGYTPGAVRSATFGQGRGPKGKALLSKLLDVAGRDLVRQAYEQRLREHMAALQEGAA